MNKIDLHIHTTASDGRMSPTQLVRHAVEQGMSHIAITDHDTVDGLLELEKSADTLPTKLSIIPGIEFSTDFPEREVHILGYGMNIHNDDLQVQLDILMKDRRLRAEKIVAKLIQLGYEVTYEQVLKFAGDAAAIGRPHIAKALVEKKYFTSITAVFEQLLAKNGPAYVPHYKLSPQLVIKIIKDAGGLPVLAHPGLIGDTNLVMEMIGLGVQGVEVYHPAHTILQRQCYVATAAEYRLAITGGSDFHAIPGRFPDKLGIFTVPPAIISDFMSLLRHETL